MTMRVRVDTPGSSPPAAAVVRQGVGMKLVGVALLALAAGMVPAVPAVPAAPATMDPAARLRVEVLERYPHDPAAFTQGLELHDGVLYESTGRYGRSEVRTSEPETGQVTRSVPLSETYFAEGLTVVGDHIWQLTWREGVAFRRDRDTLAELDQVRYGGEGWGLCHDRTSGLLVMSDGTAQLTFRDPSTFEAVSTVTVRQDGRPLEMLNELECVGGKVWANVWLTDQIVRISPRTGVVEAVVDAAGLLPPAERDRADVLNGIAAVPGTDTFLITGKLWPTVFLVGFVPAE